MYLRIIFDNVNHSKIFNNVTEKFFDTAQCAVSFGINYDDSDNELDDEEIDIIDQQN